MISDKSTILAINPPQRVIDVFDGYMDDRVKDLGLHLTLANLGDLKDEEVSRCISVLHNRMRRLSPINIGFVGEGCIKLPDSKFAIVALVSGQGLDVWRYEIAKILRDEGLLSNEVDAFQPHMTIAFTETNDRILPPSFGFKEFTTECIYFLRGPHTKIPIFTGGKDEEEE